MHEKYYKVTGIAIDPNAAPTADDYNSMLPHTHSDDGEYFLGDVYKENVDVRNQWELAGGSHPYLDHIKLLTNAFPDLRWLANWMEVTTSPVKWPYLQKTNQLAEIREERASRTKVKIIDFCDGSHQATHNISDAPALREALAKHATLANVDRMYIVEDLSRDVIEVLGSQLNIDPLFFRGQISDYWWYNMRDPWVELPELRSIAQKRTFFHLRYLQPRYFKDIESFRQAQAEAGKFNVLRRLDMNPNQRSIMDESKSCVALVRSKMSFWWQRAYVGKQGSVGVLLVDPMIKGGSPLWGGIRNFSPTPLMRSPGSAVSPAPHAVPRDSMLEALECWLTQVPKEQITRFANEPQEMLSPMCQVMCAEWLSLGRYIIARLRQVEWDLEHPDFMKKRVSKHDSVNSSLERLQPYRRDLPLYKQMIDDTIMKLFPTPKPTGKQIAIEELREDFDQVQKAIIDLQDRVEKIVGVATAIINIEESQRAMRQNGYIGRLSYLAVVFAPLSFISSFFSMTPDLGQLSMTFWIYFVIAIPIILITLGILDYPYYYEKLRIIFPRLPKRGSEISDRR